MLPLQILVFRNVRHSSLIGLTTPLTTFFSFFLPPTPSFRQKLVVFSGMADGWMKSIKTRHLLSSLWTLRQEVLDHPNVNHTLAKWSWSCSPVGHLHYLSVRESILFCSFPCYQKVIFQNRKTKPNVQSFGCRI